MQQQKNPKELYNEQVLLYSNLLVGLRKKRSNIGWLRLVIVLATLLLIYSLFINNSLVVWLCVFVGIGLFLYILSADVDNNDRIAEAERMLFINKEELSILDRNYLHRADGYSFLPVEHPYANDIDIFGKASIYQYINRCTSEQAQRLLADELLQPSSIDVIVERQSAVKAIAPQFEWRQKLQSTGLANPLTFQTEEKVKSWLEMPIALKRPLWKLAPTIFTTITLATFLLYLSGIISSSAFWLLVFVFFLFAKYSSGKVTETYVALSKIEGEISTIYHQLKLVESVPNFSPLLAKFKAILSSQSTGAKGLKELQLILKRFDFRLNLLVFQILNTFFLWDVRQANSLAKWKETYKIAVPVWFDILVQVEIINTLATLTFNHPNWVFPDVANDHFTLSGEQIGHPLIDETKRVDNSFATDGVGKVTVITGSNMAGKSTFLRSVAVNLVLAQMGAPVCAKAFTFSSVRLFSSMRVADNLAENTSTFYAELKKLKSIIDEVKEHKQIFILLDEILRGTNSLDRHAGSEALIRQLVNENAVAVIATHDVELASLEQQYPDAITNYHFDVQVEGEELYFDYKLKRGVCRSMNASLLMKKIGIEF